MFPSTKEARDNDCARSSTKEAREADFARSDRATPGDRAASTNNMRAAPSLNLAPSGKIHFEDNQSVSKSVFILSPDMAGVRLCL